MGERETGGRHATVRGGADRRSSLRRAIPHGTLREDVEKKVSGDVAHHYSELRGCVADEVRRRNGGSVSSPSSAAPKAARARVWGKGRLR